MGIEESKEGVSVFLRFNTYVKPVHTDTNTLIVQPIFTSQLLKTLNRGIKKAGNFETLTVQNRK